VNYPGGHHGFDVLDDNELPREVIEETFRLAQLAISGSHESALHGGLAEASAAGAMLTEDFARALARRRPSAGCSPAARVWKRSERG
jgi:hypothetical protein